MNGLRVSLILSIATVLAGCGHGPVLRVISNATRIDHIQSDGKGGYNKVLVTESRLADEQGREWTESAIVGIEPAPGGMAQIESELFVQAQQQFQDSGKGR